MFEIAGPSINEVCDMFPDRRFKYFRVSASMILNIMQGFSEYKEGDYIQIPHVRFPHGTKVLSIVPMDFRCGLPDHWNFLLYNPNWDQVPQFEHIPDMEHASNLILEFKPL
jgi:hypothetical protein